MTSKTFRQRIQERYEVIDVGGMAPKNAPPRPKPARKRPAPPRKINKG